MPLIDYDPPARFVAGTIGRPGERQFFLQAADATRVTTVALEKGQVSVLADRVNDMLDEVGGPDTAEEAAAAHRDDDPLQMPVDEEFTVGTMGLAWDDANREVVLDCHARGDAYDSPDVLAHLEAGEPGPGPEDDPTQLVLRVHLRPAVARAFARRCTRLVAAGRPPCPFCGGPLDANGHICPRANGYHR